MKRHLPGLLGYLWLDGKPYARYDAGAFLDDPSTWSIYRAPKTPWRVPPRENTEPLRATESA